MIPTRLLSFPLFAASFLFTSLALAQDGVRSTHVEGESTHVFSDDPLAATGPVSSGMRLMVLRFGRRSTLLRPRVHFLRELVATAEEL